MEIVLLGDALLPDRTGGHGVAPHNFPLPEDSTDKFDSTSKFRHPVLPKQGELSSGQILVFGDF
jgi:hypothetical protein